MMDWRKNLGVHSTSSPFASRYHVADLASGRPGSIVGIRVHPRCAACELQIGGQQIARWHDVEEMTVCIPMDKLAYHSVCLHMDCPEREPEVHLKVGPVHSVGQQEGGDDREELEVVPGGRMWRFRGGMASLVPDQ